MTAGNIADCVALITLFNQSVREEENELRRAEWYFLSWKFYNSYELDDIWVKIRKKIVSENQKCQCSSQKHWDSQVFPNFVSLWCFLQHITGENLSPIVLNYFKLGRGIWASLV